MGKNKEPDIGRMGKNKEPEGKGRIVHRERGERRMGKNKEPDKVFHSIQAWCP
jgi:hypothetical protein